MHVPEIDIYVTLQCDLRCAHCFLGPQLGHGRHMDQQLLELLVGTARQEWRTERLTFLGGEPTLYPNIRYYVAQALENGYVVRLISNGGPGLERFLREWQNPALELSLSFDGLENTHDSIRAKGSFRRALQSARLALELGLPVSAIISAQRMNLTEVPDLAEFLERMGFLQVTIHFVTERGAAIRDMVPSRDEWRSLQLALNQRCYGIPIRLEPTFTDMSQHLSCRVLEGTNLMFFPDGRVLHCSMFIEFPEAASYRWTPQGLVASDLMSSERAICSRDSTGHCPAIHLVNPHLAEEAARYNERINCIFHKLTQPIRERNLL